MVQSGREGASQEPVMSGFETPTPGLYQLLFNKFCRFCRLPYLSKTRHSPDCGAPECQRKRKNTRRRFEPARQKRA